MSAHQTNALFPAAVPLFDLAIIAALGVVLIAVLALLAVWALAVGHSRIEEYRADRSELAVRKDTYEALRQYQAAEAASRTSPRIVESTIISPAEEVASKRIGMGSRLVWAGPGSLGAKLYAIAHSQVVAGTVDEAKRFLIASMEDRYPGAVGQPLPNMNIEIEAMLADAEANGRRLLLADGAASASVSRARILGLLGLISLARGDVNRSLTLLTEASAMSEQVRDREGESFDLFLLGLARERNGQIELAEELYRKSLLLARKLRFDTAIADTQFKLGHMLTSVASGSAIGLQGRVRGVGDPRLQTRACEALREAQDLYSRRPVPWADQLQQDLHTLNC